MVDFEVLSHIGVGSLKFGMTREEIRSSMACPFSTFKKASCMIDSFLDSIHVFYDTNERCEAVEFYRSLRQNP